MYWSLWHEDSGPRRDPSTPSLDHGAPKLSSAGQMDEVLDPRAEPADDGQDLVEIDAAAFLQARQDRPTDRTGPGNLLAGLFQADPAPAAGGFEGGVEGAAVEAQEAAGAQPVAGLRAGSRVGAGDGEARRYGPAIGSFAGHRPPRGPSWPACLSWSRR